MQGGDIVCGAPMFLLPARFSMSVTVRVWDLPTRIFHWSLVICVIGLVTTAQIGGSAMGWHFRFGYSVLTLLLFRLVWGVVGGKWSLFSSFLYSPATIWLHIRGRSLPEHTVGHNPLGSLSVFAFLAFLLIQVATGLVSDDEITTSGPLTSYVSGEVVSAATTYHTEIGKFVLIGLVVLHIGAITFYRLNKREDLLRPMILGDKITQVATDQSRDDARSRTLAAIVFLACAALVTGVLKVAG